MRFRNLAMAALLMCMLALAACDSNYMPKPRGYFRIDFPEKKYVKLDTIEKYSFEYPVYADITNDINSPWETNWINVEFRSFRGTVFISHKDEYVKDSLSVYLDDTYMMMSKHLTKANGVFDSLICNPEKRVYGLLYSINGRGVASPVQFYLTDSTDNFVRGALYFNMIPNNDSLAPVIAFIRGDINHMIETFEWK